jgi:hypothetical protein
MAVVRCCVAHFFIPGAALLARPLQHRQVTAACGCVARARIPGAAAGPRQRPAGQEGRRPPSQMRALPRASCELAGGPAPRHGSRGLCTRRRCRAWGCQEAARPRGVCMAGARGGRGRVCGGIDAQGTSPHRVPAHTGYQPTQGTSPHRVPAHTGYQPTARPCWRAPARGWLTPGPAARPASLPRASRRAVGGHRGRAAAAAAAAVLPRELVDSDRRADVDVERPHDAALRDLDARIHEV